MLRQFEGAFIKNYPLHQQHVHYEQSQKSAPIDTHTHTHLYTCHCGTTCVIRVIYNTEKQSKSVHRKVFNVTENVKYSKK